MDVPRPRGAGAGTTSYFAQIGLGELADEGFARIGTRVRPMGERVGGLTARAAARAGARAGHAGRACRSSTRTPAGSACSARRSTARRPTEATLEERLALIGGTSTCHMAVLARSRSSSPGVWGPYCSAMVPGMWLTEGGQSATGALIDHVDPRRTRAAPSSPHEARREGTSVVRPAQRAARRARAQAQRISRPSSRASCTCCPTTTATARPRADPTLRGMVAGLKLSDPMDSLALLYLATMQAIAHGTRHIIDGDERRRATASTRSSPRGGDTKNPVFLREHADATGCRVVLPAEPEAVLLGAAMLGAVAVGRPAAACSPRWRAMNRAAPRHRAGRRRRWRGTTQAKYRVFQRMHDDQLAYRALMRG